MTLKTPPASSSPPPESLPTLDTSSSSPTVTTATTTRMATSSPLNVDGSRTSPAAVDHPHDHHQHDDDDAVAHVNNKRRRSSTHRYEPATHQRPSFHANITAPGPSREPPLRRQSFIVEFSKTNGPPQIAGLMMLIAIGLGCTIGVVPAVMTDRFARLNHGYDLPTKCWEYVTTTTTAAAAAANEKPYECLLGSADAQTAVSTSHLISNVLTFISSSLMGSLSDEHGRRGTFSVLSGCIRIAFVVGWVILGTHLRTSPPHLPILSNHCVRHRIESHDLETGILIWGLVLGSVPPLMLVLTQLIPTMSPWWYYSSGAATGVVNWMAVALSSLADVLPQQHRAPGIGLLLAGFMFGFSLSPILSMLLSKQTLSIVSFSTVLLGLIISILFLPETLPPEVAEEAKQRRREAMDAERDEAEAATAGDGSNHLYHNMSYPYEEVPGGGTGRSRRRRWKQLKRWLVLSKHVLTRPIRELSILNRSRFFRLISLLAFFSGMVASGDQVLLIYYLEERLGFTNRDVSIMFFIMGTMGVVAQAFLLKPLNDLLGEKLVVALAFTCGAIDNTMYGLAKHKQTIFAAVGVAGLTGMAFPTISAIKANNVAESEQGRIQGALYSLQALASGIGPVALRYVYGKTQHTKVGPGAMFVFAAGLYLIAACIACALPNDKANASRPRHTDDDAGHDDGQDSQLLSESSMSDEEDYGATTARSHGRI